MCETFCERVAWWRNVKPRENLSSRLSSVGVFFDEYPSCSLENVIARHAPGDRRSVQGERMLLTPVGNSKSRMFRGHFFPVAHLKEPIAARGQPRNVCRAILASKFESGPCRPRMKDSINGSFRSLDHVLAHSTSTISYCQNFPWFRLKGVCAAALAVGDTPSDVVGLGVASRRPVTLPRTPTRTPPRPGLAGLQCNWTMVVAVFTVGTTILLVDYLFFRDSDLEELTGPAILCRNAPTSSVNRHAEKMNAAGAGGYRGKPTDTGRRRKRLGRACLLTAWIGCLIVCDRSHRKSLVRLSLLLGAFVASLPHLVRPSKYRRDRTLGCVLEEGDMRRSVTDKLVWTSLIYIVPAVYGVVVHQYGLAFLQLMTTIGSTSYHLARETKFFNLDNVFATSLLCTILWGLFLSVWHGIWWFTLAVVVGGPLAVFCIVRCGMPGLVCPHPCGHGLCRKSNPEYDFLHMVWHVVSGFGTMVSIYFFEVHFPAKDAGGGRFHWLLDMPVVPTVSLALGVALNVYANIVGLMPLD